MLELEERKGGRDRYHSLSRRSKPILLGRKREAPHKCRYSNKTVNLTCSYLLVSILFSSQYCKSSAWNFSPLINRSSSISSRLLPSLHTSNLNSIHARKYKSNLDRKVPNIREDLFPSSTQLKMIAIPELIPSLPDMSIPMQFEQIGKQLFDNLDIGGALNGNVGNVPEAATSLVLESIGRDLLVFLAASVIVTPIATTLNVTPILGYLLAGALLGPHGLDLFANSKADVELGDFGILFLLFSEGLEVSSERLQKLTNYLPLGLAQLSLTTGVLTGAILLGAPELLERFLPLDSGLINVHNPAEAVILAFAGTLSTSAFVFPVLKEKGWEEQNSGQAATSILLLQDLAVAPILVSLPYIVGQGPTDYSAIAFLTLKATLGFGSVVFAGSYVLRSIFNLVAKTRSTETFVALCLLVSVGMGAIAKELGLTDTAGAFVAGVLLANTNYRAQIQADILPFKGILLGIFFMDAGSSFDSELVLNELPTILTGAASLILLKAVTIFTSTKVPRWMEPNRLPQVDAIRLSLLLAGGGEFAFVVLALAEKLEVLPKDLGGLLTAIVLITMGVTPLLGVAAENLSQGSEKDYIDALSEEVVRDLSFVEESLPVVTSVAEDAVVICGYEEMGRLLLKELSDGYKIFPHDFYESKDFQSSPNLPQIVAFDSDPSIIDMPWNKSEPFYVSYGDGANPRVLCSSGVVDPRAIFISFEEYEEVLSATSRLRTAFPDSPIYVRSSNRAQAQVLINAGATEVVVESDELPQSALLLMQGRKKSNFFSVSSVEDISRAAAIAAGISMKEVDRLFNIYSSLDLNDDGLLGYEEMNKMLLKSNSGIISDEEMEMMKEWLKKNMGNPIDTIGFCEMYSGAPKQLQEALQETCIVKK